MSGILIELQGALPERYRVLRQIGQGGMATVFVAEDTRYGRSVAVKVLNPDLASAVGAERFEREIQVLGKLNHPHILPVLDSGESNGLLYYVMPFAAGESLRERLTREGQLPIDDALAVTCEIADALTHAHGLGIVHRDIKPENVLIHGGHAVVADFGIARLAQDSGNSQRLTATGMSLGTAAYMSPEQAAGEKADPRSDVYSLACMLYELLAGEPPFTGPNPMAVIARHTLEMPRSIRVVRQAVPPYLEEVILHALEKSPADRFKTMDEFKHALLEQHGTVTSWRVTRTLAHTATLPPAPTRAGRRTKMLVTGAAVFGALVIGAATVRYWGPARGRSAPSAAGGLDPHSLAVLYLDPGKDSALGHVADGLTESLINQLSQTSGLQVIPAGGVSPYRGTVTPKDSIARALKVGTVVAGDIERAGNQLQVSVRLVDGESGVDYERLSFRVPEGEFLRARDSLSASVAELLRKRLGEEVQLRELRVSTSSAEAWAAIQQAEQAKKAAERLVASGDPKAASARLVAADSVAIRAAALDARWTEPLLERADLAYRRTRLTKDQREIASLIDAGLADVARALALEPRQPRALELRATLTYARLQSGLVQEQKQVDQIITAAEADLRDAVSIDPRQATAWYQLSVVEYGRKNVVEASAAARRAYETDAYLRAAPNILERLWATSYDLEQFADAIHWCGEGRRRFPDNPRFVRCQLYLMLTKAVDPDPNQAWQLVDDLKRDTPKQDWEFARREAGMLVGVVLGRAKMTDSAHHVLAASRGGSDVDPRGELVGLEAVARSLLGERDAAISLLEQYLTNHPDHRAGFAKINTWWWRDLQQEPRFKTLIATGR